MNENNVVRFSIGWLLGGLVLVLILGMLGGWIGQKLAMPDLPSLPADEDRIVTSVQEVTISPNTAVAALVEKHHKSVWLLQGGDITSPPVMGSALTSDGVLVTAGPTADNITAAFDAEGSIVPLDRLGKDELFGLTFFRINGRAVTPLDMRSSDSGEGEDLVALGRSAESYHPVAFSYQVQRYSLPKASAPVGVQRFMHGSAITDASLTGASLLDEEGRLAGILIDPQNGVALPSSQVKASFERVAAKKHEINPLAETGVSLNYVFTRVKEGEPVKFVAEAATVVPGSEAAQAGLKRGDIITAINDELVEWQRSVAGQLARTRPFSIKAQRGAEEITVVLQPVN